uniref:GH18 domain-containing protein n=1 Tax=Strigamia maritima TaxID=126957 RepID=T1JLV5_STRMM
MANDLLKAINLTAAPKIVCYYTTWASRRTGLAKFNPEDINANLCTHMVVAFATLKEGKLAAAHPDDEGSDNKKGLYDRVLDLKKKNPSLKVLLALGGWEFGTKPFNFPNPEFLI